MDRKSDTVAPSRNEHTIRLRVRFRDVDAVGHVNNAVYLTYAEEAAVQHAQALGLGLERMQQLGGAFIVRRHVIEYRHAARVGDDLLVTTRLTAMRGMGATRETTIVSEATGKTLVTATTDFVWVSNSGRPAHIPKEIIEVFREGQVQAENPV